MNNSAGYVSMFAHVFFSLSAPKGHKGYNNVNKYTNNNNMLYIHMYMCNIIFMSNEL